MYHHIWLRILKNNLLFPSSFLPFFFLNDCGLSVLLKVGGGKLRTLTPSLGNKQVKMGESGVQGQFGLHDSKKKKKKAFLLLFYLLFVGRISFSRLASD